ncbi:MAG: hypothetical protein ACR2NZ_05315 [Rubripirellula sp.]
MWVTDQLGFASWNDGQSTWRVDARGGEHPISISNVELRNGRPLISMHAVDSTALPQAAEQFTRGNSWNVNYPQGGHSYALRLALEPIETSTDLFVLEATISLQTDLLDSHPQLDVDVDCQSIESLVPTDLSGDDEVESQGSAPISIAKGHHPVAVLLGPYDSPFTTNHSTDSLLRLRLFGDFLEKGVIRKARPWIVFDRTGGIPDEDRLTAIWKQLCDSPLPLT